MKPEQKVVIGARVEGRSMGDGRRLVGTVVAENPPPNECVFVEWDAVFDWPPGWRKRTNLTVLPR